uniref:GAG-pre-integrase domain-containing protein n=1 Tax=Fagus sylvatica TaxID=28930 RepID=A0A2N9HR30_FAGSY
MLSPALPSRHRQKSGCLRCQEADSSPNRLAATLGSPATGLQSQHLCSRWKDLEKLDPTVQESTPYDVRRAATRRTKFRRRYPRFSRHRLRYTHPPPWKDPRRLTQPRKNHPHRSSDAPPRAVEISYGSKWSQAVALCDWARHPPTPQKDETEDAFALRLEDWDGVNHQIITWLRNTSTPSLRQDPGERITAFHSRMRFLWDQLAASEPVIKSVSDAQLSVAYRSPLPTVNQAVNDLVREETRLKSHRSSQPHTTVLATPVSVDPTVTAPPKGMIKGDQTRRILISFVPFASIVVTLLINHSRSEALFNQVQVPSSSASNPALSVTPGISSEWFLDSACCNHMTDNPHLTSAHTPPVLPTITTADGSARLLDSRTGQIVGTARKVGRLFELTSLHFPSSSVSAPVIAASASIELWHSRLGHVSLPRIQTLVSRGLLGSVSSSPFDCMPCQLGKQPALPFNNSESIASATFDLIHSDVWGPSPVPTTQYSKAIKVFRSDNAREYRQTDFSTILKHYGTIFHTSCAGTSQQNGRAERKLRHILDTVRALTNAASTPVYGAREHHLMVTLYQLRQDPGERITAFHSRMRFLWDQLADIFTKPMPPGRFRDLISKLKLVSLHPT